MILFFSRKYKYINTDCLNTRKTEILVRSHLLVCLQSICERNFLSVQFSDGLRNWGHMQKIGKVGQDECSFTVYMKFSLHSIFSQAPGALRIPHTLCQECPPPSYNYLSIPEQESTVSMKSSRTPQAPSYDLLIFPIYFHKNPLKGCIYIPTNSSRKLLFFISC